MDDKQTASEARAEINALVDQAYNLITQAETLADEHELSFDFSLAYGMGGFYSAGEWVSSSEDC